MPQHLRAFRPVSRMRQGRIGGRRKTAMDNSAFFEESTKEAVEDVIYIHHAYKYYSLGNLTNSLVVVTNRYALQATLIAKPQV